MTSLHSVDSLGNERGLLSPLVLTRAALVIAGCIGCGSDDPEGPMGMGGSGAGGSGGAPASECNAMLEESLPSSALHLLACSATSYTTNPPSGGDHYGMWAAFQSYDFPVPEGFLVHALEHGAVVFWYSCLDGCPDEVATVEAFIASLPEDPLCDPFGVPRRVILTPSATLRSRWAASSWGYALTADCFDEAAFRDFYTEHYGEGREPLCNPGQAFTANPCP
jgi:hypothetical protein